MSGQANDVVVMTNDNAVARAVSTAVASRERFVARPLSHDLQGLMAQLKSAPAAAALIDIDAQPQEVMSELDSLTRRFNKTTFLVMSRELRNEWVLMAMQAGVRHYLLKDKVENELAGVLDRLIPNGWLGREPHGAVVTVLSAGGGSGATTVAVNLAYELHLASNQLALLIDMDQSYGAASTYLGLEGKYGIAEVLSDSQRLDANLISTTVLRYEEAIDVLASPATVDPCEPASLNFLPLARMLNVSKSMYEYCVVDASRIPIEAATALADASAVTLVVFQLQVMHLKVARSIVSALVQRGISSESIVPVANRYHKRRSMISLGEASRALGDMHVGTLSNDYQSAVASANFGQPLAQHAPRSSLRREIRSLAASVQQARKSNSRVREW
jgi:pilus assembly protein CpaE